MDENNWPKGPDRSKRYDPSKSDSSPRNRSSRINPNFSRNSSYLDDSTLHAMLSSGMMETLGPLNFSQFRVPVRQSNSYLDQVEAFGSAVDYAVGWLPKNVNLSSLNTQIQGKKFTSSKPKKELNVEELLENEAEPLQKDSRFLLPQLIMERDQQGADKNIDEERKESILEWFDRSVEKELKKRREILQDGSQNFGQVIPVKDLNVSRGIMERMSEASASRIEIATQMAMQPDTELTDAVDKFAKAEAMCAFAGAVKAAEAAAEAAPPELAEEAAVASARIFQTEVEATSTIREDIGGPRPLEVIGYVGITKPAYPIKPPK